VQQQGVKYNIAELLLGCHVPNAFVFNPIWIIVQKILWGYRLSKDRSTFRFASLSFYRNITTFINQLNKNKQ